MMKYSRLKFIVSFMLFFIGIASSVQAQPSIPERMISKNIPPGVRVFIKDLYSPDQLRRARAAMALGELGKEAAPAVPFLISLIDEKSGAGLIRVSSPSEQPSSRTDSRTTPGEEAKRALARINPADIDIEYIKLENIKEAERVNLWIAALKMDYSIARDLAGRVLRSIKDKSVIEPLLISLKNRVDFVRVGAAYALGERKNPEIVEPLIVALRDKNARVREYAAAALYSPCDSRAVEPLCAALKDRYPSVRRKAAQALGEIKDPRAIKPLIAALREDEEVQGDAVEALARLGKPAVEPLILALKDKDVRRKAAEALDKLGWETKEESEKALYSIAKQEWDECVKLGKPAVEPLIAALKDESAYIRGGAVEALNRIGDGRAVEPLILALKDKNRSVREKTVEALGKIGDSRAVEPLILALKDEDRYVRKKAVEALTNLGKPATEPLVVALKDEDRYIRRGAAEVLDELDWKAKEESEKILYFIANQKWDECVKLGKPAVEPLIAVIKDSYVGADAAKALENITEQNFGQDPERWQEWWEKNAEFFPQQKD